MLEDCFPYVDRDKESTWRFCPKLMADDPVLWSFFFLFLNHCFLIFYFSALAPSSPLFVPLRHPSTPSSPLALIPWYFLCSHGPFLSSAPLSGQRRGIHLSENERAAQIPRLPSQHSVAPCLHTDIFQPTGMSAARGEKAS